MFGMKDTQNRLVMRDGRKYGASLGWAGHSDGVWESEGLGSQGWEIDP
jgi:hypothetical protein